MSLGSSGPGRRCGSATAATAATEPGIWLLAELLADADAAGLVDWAVSIDSTIIRAHQHAANLARDTDAHTGGEWKLRELARRAG